MSGYVHRDILSRSYNALLPSYSTVMSRVLISVAEHLTVSMKLQIPYPFLIFLLPRCIGQGDYIHRFRNITTRVSGVENIRIQSAAGKPFSANDHIPLYPSPFLSRNDLFKFLLVLTIVL